MKHSDFSGLQTSIQWKKSSSLLFLKLMKYFTTIVLLSFSIPLWAQSGIIQGKVFNKFTNESIPYSNIILQDTHIGTTSDDEGNFRIENLTPGLYNLEVSYIGFKKLTIYEIEVSNSRIANVNIALEEEAAELDELVISISGFEKNEESPVSLRSIGVNEIKRNPGGNRDISKVVRSLPGVASTPSFRNDIIIRGGAPSENKYYLDGIEVPNINHFQTQGSSGGPVGLINVDFIEQVNFYSGAFPANRGNTLSSVFEFEQKDGRNDRLAFNAILGASDLGVTFDGPIGKKTTFIASARRSYLQYLFSVLNLPFLPTYNDFQLKVKHKFDEKNQLTIIGLGAIDNFKLNPGAPENASTTEDKEYAEYILNVLPITEQWNYAIGTKYEHFVDNGYYTVVLSRNMLNNTTKKYAGNDDSNDENLITNYLSQEIENKLRVENFTYTHSSYKINYGINYEYAKYLVEDFNKVVTQGGLFIRDFSSGLRVNKWGIFGQISRTYGTNKLGLSIGFRMDANDYSNEMNNLFDQFSPRFSLSYNMTPNFSFNFNTGIYYQLPTYTVLGYRNSETLELENKQNGVKYIQNKQLVAGFEYLLKTNSRLSLEGFYKKYYHYPFLVEDSISLANLGADFGTIGNAPVSPISEGRSYGLELLAQQKLFKGFYGLLAYTFVISEFKDKNGNYVPSSWDNRHLVSITGGKKFNKNWELGLRWLFTGNSPYTPYNVTETVRKVNWDVRGYGIPDYDQLNSKRTASYHQLDVRVDKKYFFKKWSLNVYLDIQNFYNFRLKQQDFIDVVRDDNGNPVTNPENPDFYTPKFIENVSGTVLPTIGIIIEL